VDWDRSRSLDPEPDRAAADLDDLDRDPPVNDDPLILPAGQDQHGSSSLNSATLSTGLHIRHGVKEDTEEDKEC
jgi:hypothetical protein